MVHVRIPFDGAADLVRQHLGAFRREDVVVLRVDHGELLVFRENAQRLRQIDGIVFGEFFVEFLLLLLVVTSEEGEKIARFVGVGGENVRQAAAADDHEAALDATVDVGGVGRRERPERNACGAELVRIDFREGEQDVGEADDIRPHLLKSLEERFFRSQNGERAEQAAALSEIGHLEIGGDDAVLREQLADFLFQLEFVRSDRVEDLDGGQLAVRFGVQREVDFAWNGVVDRKIRRDGRREFEGEAAAVRLVWKRRDFNVERGSEGWFGDLACFGHEDSRDKAKEEDERFFHIEDLLNNVDRGNHNTIK